MSAPVMPSDSHAGASAARISAEPPLALSRVLRTLCREALYGLPATQLHRELADRRVAATSPLHIIRGALRATRLDGRTFWYPKHGYGKIGQRLADAAVDTGIDRERWAQALDQFGTHVIED